PVAPITAARHPRAIVDEALQRRAAYITDHAGALYELDLYAVVLYESPTLPRQQWRHRVGAWMPQALSIGATTRALDVELRQARTALPHKTLGFVTHLADTVAPVLLGKRDAFRFFRCLLNYTPYKREWPALKYDTHLDVYGSDSTLECHRDCLRLDDVYVKVLT